MEQGWSLNIFLEIILIITSLVFFGLGLTLITIGFFKNYDQKKIVIGWIGIALVVASGIILNYLYDQQFKRHSEEHFKNTEKRQILPDISKVTLEK